MSRLYALDRLRFGAAASVLGYHLFRLDRWNTVGAADGNSMLHALGKMPDYGWMGVLPPATLAPAHHTRVAVI